MTYNPDYERSRVPHAGLGEYPNSYEDKPISGKWLLIAFAFIVVLLGGLALFAGSGTITVNDETGAATVPAITEQVPLTPAE